MSTWYVIKAKEPKHHMYIRFCTAKVGYGVHITPKIEDACTFTSSDLAKAFMERENISSNDYEIIAHIIDGYYIYKTVSLNNLSCPLCKNRFKVERAKNYEECKGSTLNCPNGCGHLILTENGVEPLHEYLHSKDSRWDNTGEETHFIDI